MPLVTFLPGGVVSLAQHQAAVPIETGPPAYTPRNQDSCDRAVVNDAVVHVCLRLNVWLHKTWPAGQPKMNSMQIHCTCRSI